MKRTQQQIIDRFKERLPDDFFGWEAECYLPYMPYHAAKEFLKDGVTEEEFVTKDLSSVRQEMVDYMPFAWEKANNCRGLSAARSIQHYQAWLWLDGDETLWQEIDEYEYYGKPQLIRVCEYLGLDASQWDDGVRTNTDS